MSEKTLLKTLFFSENTSLSMFESFCVQTFRQFGYKNVIAIGNHEYNGKEIGVKVRVFEIKQKEKEK